MNWKYRVGYYSFGFIIGLFLLFFFLGGKKTSCDYSPNSRVLKNIRIKEKNYSDEVLNFLNQNNLDTSHISELLVTGKVDFDRSNTRLDSCKTYTIVGSTQSKSNLEIGLANCDSIAKVQKINFTKP